MVTSVETRAVRDLGASPSCNLTDEAGGVKDGRSVICCLKVPQAPVIQENLVVPTIIAGKRDSLTLAHIS